MTLTEIIDNMKRQKPGFGYENVREALEEWLVEHPQPKFIPGQEVWARLFDISPSIGKFKVDCVIDRGEGYCYTLKDSNQQRTFTPESRVFGSRKEATLAEAEAAKGEIDEA